MNKTFFASLAVLVVLVAYIGAIFFCFAIGRGWPLVFCPVLLAVVVGLAYYIEYLNACKNE